MLEPITLTAPSAWACYLINGDIGDMDGHEAAQIVRWIKRKGLGWPVSCDNYGFTWNHDAFKEFPFGADCQTYTFLVSRD